ncbi:DEP domain-containing protein 7-like [Gasterosteus aculeatus]
MNGLIEPRLPAPMLSRGAASRPAQSSCVWSCLISHLRSSVTVKRRRINPKSHGDCFLSSEAVDTLEEHINCAKVIEGAFLWVVVASDGGYV